MSRTRWSALGLTSTLVLAMGAGPILVFILAATGPLAIERFDLAKAELGGLASIAFISAAASSILLGRVADRVPAIVVIPALQVITAGALLLPAFSTSGAVLAIALALSGLVQAIGNPVTNRIIAARVDRGRRGLVMGIKQSGVQLSQLAAGVLAAPLALTLGWAYAPLAVVPLAVVGGALAVVTLRTTNRPARQSRRNTYVLARLPPSVWWLAGYAVLAGAALQSVSVYLPLFGFEAVEMSVTQAGATVAVVGAIGVVARIGWGHAAERWFTANRVMVYVPAGAAAGAMLLLRAENSGAPWLVWAGAVIVGCTGSAANVVAMVATVSHAPAHLIGRASGVVATGLFVGFALGPNLFGRLLDATGTFQASWFAVLMTYICATALALVMIRFGRRRGTGS